MLHITDFSIRQHNAVIRGKRNSPVFCLFKAFFHFFPFIRMHGFVQIRTGTDALRRKTVYSAGFPGAAENIFRQIQFPVSHVRNLLRGRKPCLVFSEFFHIPAGTQHIAHPLGKDQPVYRFVHEICRTHVIGHLNGIQIIHPCDHQNRHICSVRHFPQFPACGKTVHFRHFHIQQHNFRAFLTENFQSFLSVFRFPHFKACLLQGLG